MVRLTDMDEGLTIEKLKSEYSSALYSYFRVTNLKDSYKKFRQDPAKSPKFRYPSTVSLDGVNERINRLRKILNGIDPRNQAEIAFVEWRLAESMLLREFRKIYEESHRPTSKVVEKYIVDQEELYAALDPKVFGGIIRYIRITAHHRGPSYTRVMDAVESRLNAHSTSKLFSPKPATFQHYKTLFSDCFPELYKVLQGIRSAEGYGEAEIVEIFEKALESVGAKSRGWKVEMTDGGANIIAAKYSKKILVGKDFQPTDSLRFKQIVAHEVGCHVQRAMADHDDGAQPEFDESDEGLAIVMEQLLASRFMYKRIIRYLAICLAVGMDGKKRNFSEVYEILWRVTYIISADKRHAKEQAFYETARAFRGGMPSVSGMVYIKDKIYLESNLIVWEKLEEKLLNKTEFRRLFRGQGSRLEQEKES